VFSPAVAAVASTDNQLPDKSPTIFHVNDRHGRMMADPYLEALVGQTPGDVLILDAGDTVHGQPAASLSRGERWWSWRTRSDITR